MSDHLRLPIDNKQANSFDETNMTARLRIEAERIARNEKTARLRKLREDAAKGEAS